MKSIAAYATQSRKLVDITDCTLWKLLMQLTDIVLHTVWGDINLHILTHYGLVMLYGNIDLGQNWLR